MLVRTEPVQSDQVKDPGPFSLAIVLERRLAELGAELLIETLSELERGTLQPRPQDDAAATLAPSFKKQDGAIDWALPATVLERRVRALQPWPGTFTFRDGERWAIWRTEVVAARAPADAEPGTVLSASDEGILVACGDGVLSILELQRAGGKRQSVAEFLRGRPIDSGERLTAADS